MISVTQTHNSAPPRMILHGGAMVGKSTFASQAPRPIFLPTEEGLKGIQANALTVNNKARLETYEEFNEALNFAEKNLGNFDTLVIDSADWLESLIHDKICRDSKKSNIAEAKGGFGKGYIEALNTWNAILTRLDRINAQGKWIILICHSKSVLFNDPVTEPYDIWTMKLHSPKGQNGSLELLKEWADIIAFATIEKFVNETNTTKGNDGSKIHRMIETGNRILNFESSQAFLAGNRYGLKKSCDLTWNNFINQFTVNQ